MKRARARSDANRERQDIVTLVKRQLTREIAEGRFRGGLEAVKREIDRRVKERMIMSRNNNYARLRHCLPLSLPHLNNPACAGGICTPKPVSKQKNSTTYKKQSHHPASGASGPPVSDTKHT